MWEMTSGIPAFNSVPHDFDLSLAICRVTRPDIIETSKIFDDTVVQKVYKDKEIGYIELMKKYWDSNPDKRPKAEELYMKIFHKWFLELFLFIN